MNFSSTIIFVFFYQRSRWILPRFLSNRESKWTDRFLVLSGTFVSRDDKRFFKNRCMYRVEAPYAITWLTAVTRNRVAGNSIVDRSIVLRVMNERRVPAWGAVELSTWEYFAKVCVIVYILVPPRSIDYLLWEVELLEKPIFPVSDRYCDSSLVEGKRSLSHRMTHSRRS